MPEIVSFSKLRAKFKEYCDKACNNHEPIYVTRQNGEDMVIISKSDYEQMDETTYLMSSPENAKRLTEAMKEDVKSHVAFEDVDDLRKHLGLE